MTSPKGFYYRVTKTPTSGAPLVLVMGYGGSADAWSESFINELAKTFQVLVLDNRGTGRSPKPEAETEYTIEKMAGDLDDVVQAAGFERFHLLGWSLGGTIALQYAHSYSQKLKTLTLMTTTGGGPLRTNPPQAMLDALEHPVGDTLWELYLSTWRQCFSEKGIETHWKELQEIFNKSKSNLTPLTALHGHMYAFNHFDSSKWVSSIKVPTQVIVGEADRLIPMQNGVMLSQKIPGSTLVKIAQAEHCPHIEFPEKVISALLSFCT